MKKTFLSLLFLVHTTVFAQVTITFPVNRAIFQRNQSNTGVIPLGGTFQARVDRIDARLIPIKGGNAVDWTPVAVNPNFGTFTGGIYSQAGWYKLEIRAFRGGTIVGTASLDKVGIGEVLIIAGQSNAQGYEGKGNPPANDERVNCISNYYSYDNTEPPFPVVSQLSENVKIAPLGNGSWCWGRLGDLLAQKLNVPILFINTAYEAMGIEDWSKSADGDRGFNYYTGNYERPGYPFENLKKSLHYYANMFGARGILWHQGETDNDKKTSTAKYKDALEYLIRKSRGETGKNISWMVSRVSRVKSGTYQPVIEGQNETIREVANVFEGPETDVITARPDGVHFDGNSLIQLAEAWNNKFDANFFAKSNPLPASFPLFFFLNCDIENKDKPLRIVMPDGFKSYYWTNGFSDLNNSSAIETGTGYFRGRAVDYLGNVYYTPTVNYSALAIPEKPNLSAEGATSFCEGGSVKLTSSTNLDITWNNGEHNQSIVVNQPGNYSVSQYNYLGCSTKSNEVKVSILPKPEISIVAEGPTTFCSDKSLNLRSNIALGNNWNTGENKQSITVNKSGEYFVSAKNEFGCENTSPKISITVNPVPEKPTVIADGPTVFCADKSVRLSSSVEKNIAWNTGEKTNSLLIARTGDYFVTAQNEFGCQNISNITPIRVNPLPPKPTITASGPTTFCEGESVTLTATPSQGYQWNNAKTTNNQTVKSTGFFSVKVIDQNGCVSPTSDETSVLVKAVPQGINILQTGTYTLESVANGFYDLKYEWSKDGVKLPNDVFYIKAKESGNYTVRGSILYQLGGGNTLRCFSAPSNGYNFIIDPSNKGVSIFPNPAPKSIINIETLDDLENAVVSFYDFRGFLLREYTVPKFDTRKTFDLKDMPKGMFLIGVKAKDLNVIKRAYIE
ncbi:sialate O-acetylesterase [Emticicia sp. SJ17W-69]|uniref:sialate O-acetylesterase n=1 Tax=Emticicia sp. SJ17W-69 TaxID=3421657 RepID=UPI003EB93757